MRLLEQLDQVAFARPGLLWSIPALWLITFAFTWRRRSPTRWLSTLAAATIRATILSLVALTLAGPTDVARYLDPVRWIILRDGSERRSDAARAADDALIDRIRGLDPSTASVESLWFARDVAADASAVDGTASVPSTALDVARRQIRADRRNRIVVLTDARFTEHMLPSDWPDVTATNTTVGIYHVPPGTARQPDPRVRALRVPPRVDAGAPFDVEVRLRSDADGPAEIVVTGVGREARRQRVDLSARFDRYVTIPVSPLPRGTYAINVSLEARADRESRNNRLAATLTVGPPPRVLILDEARRDGGPVKTACVAQGFTPIVVTALPKTGLDTFRAVVLRNRAIELPPSDQRKLIDFVLDGGGLLVAGGPAGDGLARLIGQPLGDILPVAPRPKPPKPEPTPEPEPPEPTQGPKPEVKRSEGPASSVSAVLVLDISNSMNDTTGGHPIPPIRYAKEAAIAAAKRLRDQDRLAVICFNTTVGVVVPLQEIGKRRKLINERIAKVGAAGGTLFLPPLERAYRILRRDDARVKHVILLTDGARHDSERYADRKFETLAGRMVDRKITLTAVGLGLNVETRFLAQLVKWNGQERGGLFLPSSPTEIPALFTLEVDRLLAQAGGEKTKVPDVDPNKLPAPPAKEPDRPRKRTPDPARTNTPPDAPRDIPAPPIPVRPAGPHPMLVGLEGAWPPVTGFDPSDRRPLGWIALETESGAPILATKPHGLGRVAVVTTDLGGQWSEPWIRWTQFPRLLAQALRFLGRAAPDREPPRRDGRVHPARFDVTGEDAFQRQRFASITGASALPPLRPGRWPGEPERERRKPLEPYALLIAAILLPIEIAIRRFSR